MTLERNTNFVGLCQDCAFARVIRSDRGAVFYQCGKSFEDPSFPKYPHLPVVKCAGYRPLTSTLNPLA